jgi:hypothetical protein
MYCKHCGKEIADDSKFCQHCGGKQDVLSDSTKYAESDNKKLSAKGNVIEIPSIKINFSDKTKWLLFGYGIWIVLNLYCLYSGDKSDDAASYFQPFADVPWEEYSYYDISEFIVYVIGVPLAIWGFLFYRKSYKGKDSQLIKFIKSKVFFFIVLIVIFIGSIISISRCSHDKYYKTEYYQPPIQTHRSEITYSNTITGKEYDFNSQMEDINNQMKKIQKQQIENLPSEYDNYYR